MSKNYVENTKLTEACIKHFKLDNYPIDINSFQQIINNGKTILEFKLNQNPLVCPKCNSPHVVIHDYVTRIIKHPVAIGVGEIEIHLKLRRFKCKDCNKFWSESNPIANSNISFVAIEFLMNQLQSTKKTFTQLSKECFISKSSLIDIFDKCITVSNEITLPEIVSFDEVCVGHFSHESKYIFVMFDPINNSLVDIYQNRLKSILNQKFRKIPISIRENVKYVTMDGWDPYRVIVKKYFPNAAIALDSFHVLEAISRGLDKIRLIIAKKFKQLGTEDGQATYRLLKDNKTIFGYDWKDKAWPKYLTKKTGFESYQHFIAHIRKISPEFSKAYALKEEYRLFNKLKDGENIHDKLLVLLEKFKSSPFAAYKEVGIMITNWFEEIINSFKIVNGKRLSTSKIERHNQFINSLDSNGCGYSNFERFRKRIMLFYKLTKIDVTQVVEKLKK